MTECVSVMSLTRRCALFEKIMLMALLIIALRFDSDCIKKKNRIWLPFFLFQIVTLF